MFLAVGLVILLTTFAAYSVLAITPPPSPNECQVDYGGVYDPSSGQKDLTQMCQDPTSADPLNILWQWDITTLSGANTADGCALFDSDGDGYANYSFCAFWYDGAEQNTESPTLYSCNNTSTNGCYQNEVLISPVYYPDGQDITKACEISVEPWQPFDVGVNTPNDAVAECTINPNLVDGGLGELIDVCSYPSGSPNSVPSDCILYTDKTGKLEVVKSLAPPDSGLFNLQVDGEDKATNIGDGGTTGEQIVDEGSRTVSETVGTGTTLGNFETNIECRDQNGIGDPPIAECTGCTSLPVDIVDGDDVVCTITNTQKNATLTVVKDPTNDSGGTAIPNDFLLTVNGEPILSGAENEYDANTNLALGETQVSGYTFVSIDKTGTGSCPSALDTNFQLQPGDDVTCTITNDDQPSTLIVKKMLINDNGGTKVASDFEFSVNGGAAISFEANGQNDLTVDAGTYSIVETAVSGYTTIYDNCTDVVIANGGSATCTITNNDIDYKPIIKIVKTGPTTAKVGDNVTYNFEVTNDDEIGDGSPIDNVSVTDTIAGTATYVSGDTGADGILEVGETWIFTADYIILTTDPNPLVNTGTANGKDLNGDPVSDNDDHSLNVEYWTDLSITKEGPVDEVMVNSQFNFYITVHNAGPSPAVNVVVTDTLPSDLSYVTAFPIPDVFPTPIVWNLGTMSPGQTEVITLTVNVQPWAGDTITNVASASTDTLETDYTNNQDDAIVTVAPPNAVTMTAEPSLVEDGDQITINWQTGAEPDVYGFNIYRSNVNVFSTEGWSDYVDSQGDVNNGATYSYTDTPPWDDSWYYWLTIVSYTGEGDPYGPLTAGENYFIFLPAIFR